MRLTALRFIILSFLTLVINNSYSQKIITLQKVNGVFNIPCKVNGILMNFIFDTGASDVSISLTEAKFLEKQGLLSAEDYIGKVKYRIANGDVEEGIKIILKKVSIEGLILENVEASIVNNLKAPLLFGLNAISKLGKVVFEDDKLVIYPNNLKIEPAEKNKVDVGVTGESIIAKHIVAVGGNAAIEALKDVVVNGDAKIPGAPMDFAVNQKYLLSNNFSMTMAAGPRVVMKQGVKNGECYQEQQGQKQTLNEEDKEEILEETTFINEIYYLKNKYTFTPKAIEVLDGKEVYVVEITSQKGRVFTNYYNVVTGLKAKMTKVIDADGKRMAMDNTFSDYQSFEGIKVPMKTIMDIGIKISINYKEVKINTGLKKSDF